MGALGGAYLVDPQDPRVEGRALIFLEELKVDVHKIRCFECFHHPKQDVDVSWPLSLNSRDGFGSKLSGFSKLCDIIINVADIAPQD